MNKEFNKGLLLAGFGSFWWGFFGVLYFKYITFIGYIELVVHRCLWTTLTLILTTFFFSKWDIFFKIIKSKQNLIYLFISGFLIFMNWGVWIYAIATNRIIDAGYDKIFVYASTGSVYGALDTVCTEQAQPNPISTYAIYKLLGEKQLEGTDAVILRPATAFGVSNRLRHDLLVNDFVRKACNNVSMTLFEGHHKRTFLSVNDLVRAFAWGIEKYDVMKGDIWNVGDNRLNYTKLEICQMIQNIIPTWHYTIDNNLLHDQDGRNYFVDYEKIRNIGFTGNETLKQGIINLIKVYKNLL